MSADDERDHRQRMATLGRMAPPTPGSPDHVRLQQVLKPLLHDAKHCKAIKAMHERAMATLDAQQRSGAGYEADQTLRYFQREYNNRFLKHGRDAFPASFEVGEAFFTTTKEFAALLLLPERDYLVSFGDFLDYVTAADAPAADVEKAYQLEDGVIYNVSSTDVPDALLLQTDADSSFGFVAASMARRCDELALLMVLGEQRPLRESDTAGGGTATPRMQLNPDKPFLQEIDLGENEPRCIANCELLRTLALVRFNLRERRLECRLLMHERTKSFHVVTDIGHLFEADSAETARRLANDMDKLNSVGSVWELAKTLVLLPSYLAARIDLVHAEQRTTRLGVELRSSMKARRAMEHAAPQARVLLRHISAIRVLRPAPALIEGRSYRAPDFQVPVEGYWRQFADGTRQGHDENNEPVLGRTWVRAHIRYRDKEAPPEPKIVYIKASLSAARARLERYRKSKNAGAGAGLPTQDTMMQTPSSEGLSAVPTEDGSGLPPGTLDTLPGAFLYVMRCPAHGRDIYKVGYTDRDPETRARELSAATASPTHFLVVQAWAVSEGLSAEKAAHETIERFRLAANREFFQAPYAELRRGIEGAIAQWLLN